MLDKRKFVFFDDKNEIGLGSPEIKTLAEWLAGIESVEDFADTIMEAKRLRSKEEK